MKKLTIIFLSLIIFVGCKKEKIELCDSQNCKEYYQIWENLFKIRNNISDDYFDEHITVTKTEIDSWNDGESFNVNYNVKIDWATIDNHDQFIIKINSQLYPSLLVSRNEYLSETEIKQVLDMQAFSSYMSKINPDSKLKFFTKYQALKALRDLADSKKIKYDRYIIRNKNLCLTQMDIHFWLVAGKLTKVKTSAFMAKLI